MHLLCVGAGPKGIAVAAKSAVLHRLGIPGPRVVLVEAEQTAANWDGGTGYTDGLQRLGTLPLKDIGFPYPTSWGPASSEVNRAMVELSWPSYLIDRQELAEWVDRGGPRPQHARWADYLRWVSERASTQPLVGEVTRLELDGVGWEATLRTASGTNALHVNGVLLTGPGDPRRLAGQPTDHPRILDGRTIWSALAGLAQEPPKHVCVIGGGETAGAAAAALVGLVPSDGTVEVVSREGVLYSRGESYTENHRYSDPSAWLTLPEHVRRSFLRRTDRGVFSSGVQAVLDQAENLRTVLGTVRSLTAASDRVTVSIDDGFDVSEVAYDLVVVAVGFDPLWFRRLLGPEAAAALSAVAASGTHGDDGIEHAIEDAIVEDLTLDGFPAPLHLPMLAGVAQGAGFPNLSCLGLLSDRVLSRYVRDISAERDWRYHRTVSAHAASHPVEASPKASSVSDASITKGWTSW